MKSNSTSISDFEKEDFERIQSALRNADWNSVRYEKSAAHELGIEHLGNNWKS